MQVRGRVGAVGPSRAKVSNDGSASGHADPAWGCWCCIATEVLWIGIRTLLRRQGARIAVGVRQPLATLKPMLLAELDGVLEWRAETR